MQRIATGIVILLHLAVGGAPALAADSGWVSVQQASSISRTTRAKSEIPVSIDCRNGSGNPNVMKLEIRVVTAPNKDGRNWSLIARDDGYRWQAGKYDDLASWRQVDGQTVRGGASGRVYYCSVWHHRKAGTIVEREPVITRRYQ